MNGKVFKGVKVAEFSWVVVGPSTSRYLAEYGATVVKIESHKRLDSLRTASPFVDNKPTVDSSMLFGKHNPNKYSVSIDLQHPNGRELAWKFIRWADIVTESFSPGTMKRWGLDYDSVRKVRPDIIYLSSSMQGADGPHSRYAGFGMNAVNLCGFSEVSGWPDRGPVAPYGAYTDYVCVRFNALALIAALDYRRRTGKGQWLEQSQFETAIHFFSPPILDYQVNGRVMKRDGNRYPHASPHGVFQCQGDDSWIAISIFDEEQWHSFSRAIGSPSWVEQDEFSSIEQRKKNEDELEQLVTDWTLNNEAEYIEKTLQKAGVPAHRVSKHAEVYADPQLKHRRYFVPVEHPVMGTQNYENQSCYLLSKTPREIIKPSPRLGEHNEYVFKELLGMTDEEISTHIIDGSITTELPGEFSISM